jgi:hypothetical protein
MTLSSSITVEAARRELSLEEVLSDYIERHAELEPGSYDLGGVVFRYVPADLRASREGVRWYLRHLNAALFRELGAAPNLFFVDIGRDFLLRIQLSFFQPEWPRLLSVLEQVVRAGREMDAAMRAAAFSH